VIECKVASFDGTQVMTRPAAWFEFAYRDSRLKRDPWVLISCLLQFKRGDPAAIQTVIDEKLEIRRVKHPQWRIEPTAGSYFKNLPPGFQVPGLPHSPGTHRIPAGALLDACDCRGLRVGDALVFPKHANIIVNAGRATGEGRAGAGGDHEGPRAREVRSRARGRSHVPRRKARARQRRTLSAAAQRYDSQRERLVALTPAYHRHTG
jgi:hypothetical protein